ncbi:phage head closure protein [Eremococcus coleocola]|uniref:phage head closure protein n=1 Tax=Eremococcus coleocola TaxID=88132 RepID=UPI000417EDF1|nr:phage head closure protein [Eremococcus coleocola]
MWNDDVELIEMDYVEDSIGNQVEEEYSTIVMCRKREIPRSEYYSARQSGIRTINLFIVHPYEYDGQPYVRYEGELMKVFETYQLNSEELELKCTLGIGDIDEY